MLVHLLLLCHSPHPLNHNPMCVNTTGDVEMACLSKFGSNIRIVIPVVSRQAPLVTDDCKCSTYDSCTSESTLGSTFERIDVSPRCGCQDFTGQGFPFCYVYSFTHFKVSIHETVHISRSHLIKLYTFQGLI